MHRERAMESTSCEPEPVTVAAHMSNAPDNRRLHACCAPKDIRMMHPTTLGEAPTPNNAHMRDATPTPPACDAAPQAYPHVFATICEADNAETAGGEGEAGAMEEAFFVRSAMELYIVDPNGQIARKIATAAQIEKPGYAAHVKSLETYAIGAMRIIA